LAFIFVSSAQAGGLKPKYPQVAIDNCLEGHVTLRFDVTDSCEVTNIQIVESVPSGIFDESAIWSTKHMSHCSEAAKSQTGLVQTINFDLENNKCAKQ
jgi:TonB family protein